MRARRSSLRVGAAGLVLALAVSGASVPAAEQTDAPAIDASTRARGDAYAYLMRAIFAARRGEFRAAAGDVRRAIRLQPDSPAVYIEGAALLRSMGRHDEAGQLGRQALALDPDNPETLRFVADHTSDTALGSNANSDALREALRLYERLEAIEALDADSLRKVAHLKLLLGDMDGAIAAGRRLAEERPGDLDVTRMLYRLLVQARQEDEALQVLLRYVARHPFEGGMVEEAERIAGKLDAWDVVERELSSNEALVAGENPAQALRGQALIRLDRMEEAADALEKAVAADSFNIRARLALVWAYRNLRRLADAAAVSNGLVEENPGDSMIQIVHAQILDQQRDVRGALESFGDALLLLTTGKGEDGLTERDAIRRRIAELHLQQDQLAAARRTFLDIEDPSERENLGLGATIAVKEEDWDAARQAARRLREHGAVGTADRIEGEVFARQGRWSKADALFREAIAELGPFYRYGIARLYRDLDKPDQGAAVMQAWVDEAPESADAFFDLGRYLYLGDEFDASEIALRRAIELNPEHSAALNFLGYGLAEKGVRLEEALKLVQRALAIVPTDGAYLDSLGWVYFQMSRLDAAREPLERAAREYPNDPTILDHLGDLYIGIDENDLALAAWNRALEGAPDDPDAIRSKIAQANPAESLDTRKD